MLRDVANCGMLSRFFRYLLIKTCYRQLDIQFQKTLLLNIPWARTRGTKLPARIESARAFAKSFKSSGSSTRYDLIWMHQTIFTCFILFFIYFHFQRDSAACWENVFVKATGMNSATSPEPSGSIHLYPPHGPAAPAAPVKTQEVAGKTGRNSQSHVRRIPTVAFAKRYFAIRPRWPRWPRWPRRKKCAVLKAAILQLVRSESMILSTTGSICWRIWRLFFVLFCAHSDHFRSFTSKPPKIGKSFLAEFLQLGLLPKNIRQATQVTQVTPMDLATMLKQVARWSSQLLLILGIFWVGFPRV